MVIRPLPQGGWMMILLLEVLLSEVEPFGVGMVIPDDEGVDVEVRTVTALPTCKGGLLFWLTIICTAAEVSSVMREDDRCGST